jgi:hypothetical protein
MFRHLSRVAKILTMQRVDPESAELPVKFCIAVTYVKAFPAALESLGKDPFSSVGLVVASCGNGESKQQQS